MYGRKWKEKVYLWEGKQLLQKAGEKYQKTISDLILAFAGLHTRDMKRKIIKEFVRQMWINTKCILYQSEISWNKIENNEVNLGGEEVKRVSKQVWKIAGNERHRLHDNLYSKFDKVIIEKDVIFLAPWSAYDCLNISFWRTKGEFSCSVQITSLLAARYVVWKCMNAKMEDQITNNL